MSPPFRERLRVLGHPALERGVTAALRDIECVAGEEGPMTRDRPQIVGLREVLDALAAFAEVACEAEHRRGALRSLRSTALGDRAVDEPLVLAVLGRTRIVAERQRFA